MNDDDAFTRYFRAVMEGSMAADVAFGAMWAKFHRALASELRRSSMRSSPPRFAGVLGYDSWDWGGRNDPEPTHGPLDELASAAHEFVLVQRWEHMAGKLEGDCESIDGYVVLYLRDFLRQQRKRNDPVGYSVFISLRQALRHAVRGGDLHVITGPTQIGNDTFLGTHADASPNDVAKPETLALFAAQWTAKLLPDLVTARGGARRTVVERLCGQLRDLSAEGVKSFRVQDLVDRLRQEVRETWAGVLEEATEDWAMDEAQHIRKLVSYFLPGRHTEEAESLERLVVCVSDLLGRLEVTRPTRVHLDTLWGYLQSLSHDDQDDEPGTAALPSRRGLAKVLDIPRNRIGELFDSIAELVERCQNLLSGTVTSIEAHRNRSVQTEKSHA